MIYITNEDTLNALSGGVLKTSTTQTDCVTSAKDNETLKHDLDIENESGVSSAESMLNEEVQYSDTMSEIE